VIFYGKFFKCRKAFDKNQVFDLEKNTTSRISHSEGSKPVHKVKVDKNVYVKTRDGARIAVDVYRPDAKGKFQHYWP